jgi:hypothetical protein
MERLIEVRRLLDQVKNRFLDAGPRRLQNRMLGLGQASGAVDDHIGHRPDAAIGGNRDVDERARLIDELLELGGGLMTQHCVGTDAERCGPQHRRSRGLTAVNGVDASLQRFPAP